MSKLAYHPEIAWNMLLGAHTAAREAHQDDLLALGCRARRGLCGQGAEGRDIILSNRPTKHQVGSGSGVTAVPSVPSHACMGPVVESTISP